MRKFLQIFLLLLPTLTFGQRFLRVDTLDNYPTDIKNKISGPIKTVLQIDFNGDETLDYIVQLDYQDKTKPVFLEYWLTSDFNVFQKKKRSSDADVDNYRFINIDNDPEPEIFSAWGYEDGIDYAFYDLDLKTGNEKLLFYFNPVIIENEKDYWGYPWDIEELYVWTEDGVTMLYTSVDHDIERDGNITIPDDQKLFPVIFFTGHSTQPAIKVEEIRDRKWLTIEKIKKLCITAPKKTQGGQ